MPIQRLTGIAIVSVGIAAYITGIYIPYPGRAFSLTAIMIGAGLVAISRPSSTEGST
jgi:hypothetical protein